MFTRLGSKPVQRLTLQLKETSADSLKPETQRLRTTEDEPKSRTAAAPIGIERIKRKKTTKEQNRNREKNLAEHDFLFKQI